MSQYTAINLDPDRRYDPPDIPEIEDDDELLSNCCTANAWGEVHTDEYEDYTEHYGICSACRENAVFTDGSEDD